MPLPKLGKEMFEILRKNDKDAKQLYERLEADMVLLINNPDAAVGVKANDPKLLSFLASLSMPRVAALAFHYPAREVQAFYRALLEYIRPSKTAEKTGAEVAQFVADEILKGSLTSENRARFGLVLKFNNQKTMRTFLNTNAHIMFKVNCLVVARLDKVIECLNDFKGCTVEGAFYGHTPLIRLIRKIHAMWPELARRYYGLRLTGGMSACEMVFWAVFHHYQVETLNLKCLPLHPQSAYRTGLYVLTNEADKAVCLKAAQLNGAVYWSGSTRLNPYESYTSQGRLAYEPTQEEELVDADLDLCDTPLQTVADAIEMMGSVSSVL